MQIRHIAQATGVDVETIRYYEKQGLLPPPSRRDNGYREYGEAHVQRLAFVKHCRSLDMSLADIARLLALVDHPDRPREDVDRLVDEQLDRVRARLASMAALEKQLVELKSRCDGHHEGHPCGILQELVSAAAGEACACHPQRPSP